MIQRILTIFCSCILLIQSRTYSQDTINWRPNYQLKWDDFNAQPNESVSFAAQTDCSIAYSYTFQNNIFSTSVISYFNKNRSWSKNKNATDSILLIHEQGHFNINELFARKLREAFGKYSFNPVSVKQDLDAIFQKRWRDKLAYDVLYDQETDHGKNALKQKEWTIKILGQLNQLNGFK